jgi:hypothetical protein
MLICEPLRCKTLYTEGLALTGEEREWVRLNALPLFTSLGNYAVEPHKPGLCI